MVNMVKLNIFEVLEKVSKATTKNQKIKILQENETWALKDVLRATYDDSIEFLLPTGSPPPYEPASEDSVPTNLLSQNKKFQYFVNTATARRLDKIKREKIFINLLESIHPKDAEIMLLVINKKSLGKGITKKLIEEAFPGLIKK